MKENCPLRTLHNKLIRFQKQYKDLSRALRCPKPIPSTLPTYTNTKELQQLQYDYYRRVLQWKAFAFLYTKALPRYGGGLCNAYMGFGKTLVAIMVMVQQQLDAQKSDSFIKPALLVASGPVRSVWSTLDGDGHLAKHIRSSYRHQIIHLSELHVNIREKTVTDAFQSEQSTLVMCGYEMVRRNPWLLTKPWSLVVLDEVQKLKNRSSGVSQTFATHYRSHHNESLKDRSTVSPCIALSGTYDTNRPLANTAHFSRACLRQSAA